ERVDLASVLRSAIETSQSHLKAGGQEFTVVLPESPIELDADPIRLAQAVSNLLNNAAKYTGRGGRIWLIAERSGAAVMITARDTGVGIPAVVPPHVFEVLTQGEHMHTRALAALVNGV